MITDVDRQLLERIFETFAIGAAVWLFAVSAGVFMGWLTDKIEKR